MNLDITKIKFFAIVLLVLFFMTNCSKTTEPDHINGGHVDDDEQFNFAFGWLNLLVGFNEPELTTIMNINELEEYLNSHWKEYNLSYDDFTEKYVTPILNDYSALYFSTN